MHRRDFLSTGAAALAFSSFPFAEQFARPAKRSASSAPDDTARRIS